MSRKKPCHSAHWWHHEVDSASNGKSKPVYIPYLAEGMGNPTASFASFAHCSSFQRFKNCARKPRHQPRKRIGVFNQNQKLANDDVMFLLHFVKLCYLIELLFCGCYWYVYENASCMSDIGSRCLLLLLSSGLYYWYIAHVCTLLGAVDCHWLLPSCATW